jgi:hypothetical protein
VNLPVAEGRLGRQPGTAWQSSRRCPTGDDDRSGGRSRVEDAHFINSVHNRIRTFVTRRGFFPGYDVRPSTAYRVTGNWRGSLSQNELATRISVRGRRRNRYCIDTFNYTSKLREPREWGMVAKHARSRGRPGATPVPTPRRAGSRRRYGIVALKGARGAPGRTLNCPNTVAKCKQEDHSPKEVRRNATHETDELTLAVQ